MQDFRLDGRLDAANARVDDLRAALDKAIDRLDGVDFRTTVVIIILAVVGVVAYASLTRALQALEDRVDRK